MNPNIPSGTEMLAGVMVVPLILGLIEVAKSSGLNTKYAPAVALLLGLLISVGYAAATGTRETAQYAQAVMIGLAYGLSASGLYSGVANNAIHTAQVKYWGFAKALEKDTEADNGLSPSDYMINHENTLATKSVEHDR